MDIFAVRAPKLSGGPWLNIASGPDLSGKVILYDFWTYSCVNCLRTLPYLKEWWKKYKNKGFVLIGIHTPEFDFEKNLKNVEQAVKDLGVSWPVVMDNDYVNWSNFANHYWPAKYLADKTGKIVYTHFGEGGYAETEKKIQELLMGGSQESMPKVQADEHSHGNVCFIPTPETYCGYGRGFLSNPEGYVENELADYKAPEKMREDSIALLHKFRARSEYVESGEAGATLILNFHATEVNLVLAAPNGMAVVMVKLNGKSLPSEIRGKDVNEAGEVTIGKSQLYNLLKSKDLVEGFLTIEAKEGIFQAYAFTFSGCKE